MCSVGTGEDVRSPTPLLAIFPGMGIGDSFRPLSLASPVGFEGRLLGDDFGLGFAVRAFEDLALVVALTLSSTDARHSNEYNEVICPAADSPCLVVRENHLATADLSGSGQGWDSRNSAGYVDSKIS